MEALEEIEPPLAEAKIVDENNDETEEKGHPSFTTISRQVKVLPKQKKVKKEQDNIGAKKKEERAAESIKSNLLISGAVIVFIGALFAISKKLRES